MPGTLGSLNNPAFCLKARGKVPAALLLFRRAAGGFDRMLGPDHPMARTVRANFKAAGVPGGAIDRLGWQSNQADTELRGVCTEFHGGPFRPAALSALSY